MANYAYARASTIVQETSCAVQEDLMCQAIEQCSEILDRAFIDEDTSGRVYPFLDREAAKQLMAVVKPGDHVHVHKLDRLGRSTVDILNTITAFMNRSVHLHVLDFGGQALNLEGATGFAMVAMQAVFAEVEAKRISERTKEALKYRRDRGMPVNAHSPFGMRRKKRKRPSGKHEPYDEWDAGECQDIREIYRRVRENGERVYHIAIEFAKQGRKTANGKPWARPPKREGGVWRDGRVRRVFNWYTCLRGLKMDVESAPVATVAVFSSYWRRAKAPRNLSQWRSADPDGLEEFLGQAK